MMLSIFSCQTLIFVPLKKDRGKMHCKECFMMFSVSQTCLTIWDGVNCRPLGSSVHGIFEAKLLEWVAISCSRGSSWPRDQTHISCISCIGRRILYHQATLEAQFSCTYTHYFSYSFHYALSPDIECSSLCSTVDLVTNMSLFSKLMRWHVWVPYPVPGTWWAWVLATSSTHLAGKHSLDFSSVTW